jgi:hypothetical protein
VALQYPSPRQPLDLTRAGLHLVVFEVVAALLSPSSSIGGRTYCRWRIVDGVLSMAYCRWRTCRRWAVRVVDRRCVSLLGCPYFRLAVCVVSGWYVSSMGGTHGGKVKSEPRQRSWFVFVTHWPGFPPPGCPLVFSFSSSSAEDEEPPSGEGRGACWWKSVVGCRCVSVGVPLLLSPSSSSTCRCSRVVVVASLSL